MKLTHKKIKKQHKHLKKTFNKHISKSKKQYNQLQNNQLQNNIYNVNTTFTKLEPNEKIAIITIFRDDVHHRYLKPKQKFIDFFANHKDKEKFDIFIIEQSPKYEFNIGKLKNVGFDIAMKHSSNINNNPKSTYKVNYNYFIFTDIDAIPDKQLFPYYLKKINGFSSLAIEGTRYFSRKDLKKNIQFFGMTCGMNKETFVHINGYPNNFWGWGGEDDSLGIRLQQTNTPFFIPQKGSVIDTETNDKDEQISTKDKVAYLKAKNLKETIKNEKTMNEINIWKINGINNLKYKLLKTTLTDTPNITIYTVDLLKSKDLPEWTTPTLEFPTDSAYKKYQKEFTAFRNKNLRIDNKLITYF
jgi:hypothetical protein